MTLPPESSKLIFILHYHENSPMENVDRFAFTETECQQIGSMCFPCSQLGQHQPKVLHLAFYSSWARWVSFQQPCLYYPSNELSCFISLQHQMAFSPWTGCCLVNTELHRSMKVRRTPYGLFCPAYAWERPKSSSEYCFPNSRLYLILFWTHYYLVFC